MISLSNATLGAVPPGIRVPGYDRAGLRTGIVHIGVGNFHRVHQAVAIETLLEAGRGDGWAICGVGIVVGDAGRAKAATFKRQDCLYGVTELAGDGSSTTRVIGAMADYLYAPDDEEAVLSRLASADTHIVSLTITEGGYDLDKILQEDSGAGRRGAFGFIVDGLERRRQAGLHPFTVMSCDNLRSNGDTSRRIVLALAARRSPELARWIGETGAFPNSMVDRIAPAVSDEDRRMLAGSTGIDDGAPALCEVYTNWVMQDQFCDGRPPFEEAGVSLRPDVADFEAVKGRLSNAAHMMLAYPGLLMGYRLVSEAMAEPLLDRLLKAFWRLDSIALVKAPPGLSPERFTAQVIERFANRGIKDTLARVAGDGASKIVVFHAKTIRQLIEGGRPLDREAFLIACFARYLAGRDDKGKPFPVFEPQLTEADWALIRDTDPAAVLRISPFAELGIAENGAFEAAFRHRAMRLAELGTPRALTEMLEADPV